MLDAALLHEFKNLLAAVLVNAEFLRRDAADPAVVHEVADEILRATERARELLEQILRGARSNVEPRTEGEDEGEHDVGAREP